MLVIVMAALSLYGGFGGGREGVAHFAHLGCALGGGGMLRFREPHPRWGKIPLLAPRQGFLSFGFVMGFSGRRKRSNWLFA